MYPTKVALIHGSYSRYLLHLPEMETRETNQSANPSVAMKTPACMVVVALATLVLVTESQVVVQLIP